jgi:poly-beta-1,6-N-acetyl-D-glucosamine synthase
MTWVFWISCVLVGYAYFGYPLWLYFRARWWSRPVQKASIAPSVSIVIAVHNEAAVLPKKLENLALTDYPADRLEIIVVSDGSTDDTNGILAAEMRKSLRAVICPSHRGKAFALNQGIQVARGEIIVFTDSRQWIEPRAIRNLVGNFADSTVGGVTGELMLGNAGEDAVLAGVGLYWQVEKAIRKLESAAGSVLGATGALYAVRRRLLVPLPEGTILDDVYLPLQVVRQGFRVVFEPLARAWDSLEQSPKREFRRKVRTLTGNYQLVQLAPWLLTSANPVRFEFVSHKLLRLLIPFALLTALIASLWLTGAFYRLALTLQLGLYSLGVLASLRRKIGFFEKPARLAFSFLLLNMAAVMALINFLKRRKEVWVR